MLQKKDCGFYIKHINDVLQRDSNNELRSQGLTFAQISILLELEAVLNNELTQKALEKSFKVAQSTASGIIARLEQKGFVLSFANSEDKRIKIVRLTEQGLACCKKARAHMKKTEEALLSSLTLEECEEFKQLLQKVSDSL